MRRTLPTVFLVALATVPLVVASCGGGGGAPPTGPQTPAVASGGTSASALIGPQGGTVSVSNGTSVSVPVGALASAQTITITPSDASPDPAGVTVVGSKYDFGPDGLTFSRPVTVTLAYDPTLVPAGKSASDVKVYMAPHGSRDFTSLPTIPVDSTHVAAPSMHFSTGAAGSGAGGASTLPAGSSSGPIPTLPPEAGPVPIAAQGEGDWFCNSKITSTKRFYTASECLLQCRSSGVNPAGGCYVKPTCPGIRRQIPNADNNSFSALFRQASGADPLAWFGSTMITLPNGGMGRRMNPQFKAGAVDWIAETFFQKKPNEDFVLTVAPLNNEWAHLGQNIAGIKYELAVDESAFNQASPGAMVAALGHELIHLVQRRRSYDEKVRMNLGTIRAVKDALWEVEAYWWETGQTPSFAYDDHKESTERCGTVEERYKAQAALFCYQWKAMYLIVRQGLTGSPFALDVFKGFMNQDPWISQIWIPKHRDWEKWGRQSPDLDLPPSPVLLIGNSGQGVVCSQFAPPDAD